MSYFTVSKDFALLEESGFCAGDKWAHETFKHYQSQKRKCYKYTGKSAVNKRRWLFYERLLFPSSLKDWWNLDKAWVNNILWLQRRIKTHTTKDEEYLLLLKFAARLPMHRLFFNFGYRINKNPDLLKYFKDQRANKELLI